MHNIINPNKAEFTVFQDVLFGKLHPSSITQNNETAMNKLITIANQILVKTDLSKSQISRSLNSIDHHMLGYRSKKDYQTQILPPNDNSCLSTVTIKPNIYYLNGNLNIKALSSPPCPVTTEYFKLMVDELQRIKTRAFWILNQSDLKEVINNFVCKNLKIAEYLAHECQTVLANLHLSPSSKSNNLYIYVFETLKSFIIKAIEFYLQLFQPYLSSLSQYFNNIVSDLENDYYDQISSSQFINEMCGTYNSKLIPNPTENNSANTNIHSEPSIPVSPTPQKIQWNKNINLLATYYIDLLENNIISLPEMSPGSPIVSENVSGCLTTTQRKFLTQHICANFLDHQGFPLSPHTIKTYLNPNKPERRSKRSPGLNPDKFKD